MPSIHKMAPRSFSANMTPALNGNRRRHHGLPEEQNVFSPETTPSELPTMAPVSNSADNPTVDDNPVLNDSSESLDERSTGVPCSVSPYGESGTIHFFYQIETASMLIIENLNAEILPQVETAIDGSLLLELSGCGEGIASPTIRKQRQQSGIVGLNSEPSDKIFKGVPCEGEMASTSNSCIVVQGFVTIFVNRIQDMQKGSEMVKEAARNAMERGEFNRLDEKIVSISYRNETTIDRTNANTKYGDSTGNRSASGVPHYSWVLISLSIFFVLFAVALRVRKKRRTMVEISGQLGILPNSTDISHHNSIPIEWSILQSSLTGPADNERPAIIGISPRAPQSPRRSHVFAPLSPQLQKFKALELV